jgi:hypothetical protein
MSKNRQSSSPLNSTGATPANSVPNSLFVAAVGPLSLVKFFDRSYVYCGTICTHMLPAAPVCTPASVSFSGGSGLAKRRAPSGGAA